jgi:hypothetical protein
MVSRENRNKEKDLEGATRTLGDKFYLRVCSSGLM